MNAAAADNHVHVASSNRERADRRRRSRRRQRLRSRRRGGRILQRGRRGSAPTNTNSTETTGIGGVAIGEREVAIVLIGAVVLVVIVVEITRLLPPLTADRSRVVSADGADARHTTATTETNSNTALSNGTVTVPIFASVNELADAGSSGRGIVAPLPEPTHDTGTDACACEAV
jgi:hypothetical protein